MATTGWNPTSMPKREGQFTPMFPDLSRSAHESEGVEEMAAGEEA